MAKKYTINKTTDAFSVNDGTTTHIFISLDDIEDWLVYDVGAGPSDIIDKSGEFKPHRRKSLIYKILPSRKTFDSLFEEIAQNDKFTVIVTDLDIDVVQRAAEQTNCEIIKNLSNTRNTALSKNELWILIKILIKMWFKGDQYAGEFAGSILEMLGIDFE